MKEELIVSGRMNPGIDPFLNIWHWSIPLYLFLGGLAAGLLFFAAYQTLRGKDKEFLTSVRVGPILAFGSIIIGLIALLYDLHHPLYFWQLYTIIRVVSPMSWGAWTLLLIMPLNIIWIFSYVKDLYPVHKCRLGFVRKIASWFIVTDEADTKGTWDWKHKAIRDFENYIVKDRKPLAWIIALLAIVLGVYTGILLSAFNARPLWNTALLGPLFLVSGLSTGAALLMIITKNKIERKSYNKVDIMLVLIELFFITHWFMGYKAGSLIKVQSIDYFLGGQFTVTFWVNVIILGLAVPLILEVLELMKLKIPVYIPALLILWGGIAFRFIMVDAGQIIRYLY